MLFASDLKIHITGHANTPLECDLPQIISFVAGAVGYFGDCTPQFGVKTPPQNLAPERKTRGGLPDFAL